MQPNSRVSSAVLARGIANAMAAGLAWGLVFIAPVLLPDYSAPMLAFGRYLAFGLIALPLAWFARPALAQLRRADWIEALKLSLVGNIVYYLMLSAGIQAAGVPVPTMLIGTLPVVIAIFSNFKQREIAWRRLAPSLTIIALGVAAVNWTELKLAQSGPAGAVGSLWWGALLTVGAVLAWTWYPIRNARWLKNNPSIGSSTWATAQGVATLPLAALGMAGLQASRFWRADSSAQSALTAIWGPQPWRFLALMLTIGLLASWLGTKLWNRASQLLPTALAGQLIVFETLAALAYGFIHRGQAPEPIGAAGIVLLVIGVVLASRSFQRRV